MSANDWRVEEAAAPYLAVPLLTDHIDTFASAPEGFKRLRELVLNLAVRGRLVKQSPGWKDTTLAHIGTWAIGSGFPHAAQGQTDLPILFAKVSDMNLPGNEVEIRSTNNTINEHTARSIRANIHPAGTVVFPKIGGAIATNKRRILVRPTAIDNNCLGITPSTSCSTAYLYLLLTSLDFTQYQAGTSVPALSQGVLGSVPVLLPPLAEQSRIVAKVEELMALIDALEAKVGAGETARGKLLDALLAALADSPDAAATAEAWAQLAPHFDLLIQTPADVDRLQQTLLQLAVKGRLVPQNPNDEPAAELLKRIRAEKARLAAEGKIKRDKPLPAISEDDQPYQLPKGWHWLRLGNAVTKMDAGWSPACEGEAVTDGSAWAVLKTTAVQVLEFRQYENKRLPAKLVPRPDCETETGDILITRAGPKNRVGISCLVERVEPKLMISDKIIRFHPVEKALNPKFVSLCLNAGASAQHVEAAKSGMAESQMNISQADLRGTPIPICPLPEQSRIVAAVAVLTALCDRLRDRLAARRALSAKLAAALSGSALA